MPQTELGKKNDWAATNGHRTEERLVTDVSREKRVGGQSLYTCWAGNEDAGKEI